eukprot:scaffold104960_cov29-Attheya_sp.AAC.4
MGIGTQPRKSAIHNAKKEEWKNQQHGGPAKWTSSWTSHERPQQPPNNQWRAPAQQQANHAYQMAAQGPPPQYQMAAQEPPPQYPPQWTQHPGPNHNPNGPPANQGGPWGQGYP